MRKILIFSFVFFILHFAFPCFAQDKIVAVINNDIITQKDLDDFLNFARIQLSSQLEGEQMESKIQSMKADILTNLIENRLILQEAKKSKIKIEEEKVKAKLNEIKRRYRLDSEFQAALTRQGLAQVDVEQKIREQLYMYTIIDEKIKSKIVVNPSEITDFYQKNIDEMRMPEQRDVEVINTSDENTANKVAADLKSIQDIQAVAKNYGLTVNKFTAGLGGQLRKEIEEVVFKLSAGQASEPVKIQDTYYIFKLNVITSSRQQSLPEIQDKIYALLFEQKMQQALASWLDELKKRSYIKILQD